MTDKEHAYKDHCARQADQESSPHINIWVIDAIIYDQPARSPYVQECDHNQEHQDKHDGQKEYPFHGVLAADIKQAIILLFPPI